MTVSKYAREEKWKMRRKKRFNVEMSSKITVYFLIIARTRVKSFLDQLPQEFFQELLISNL
jgi:hypothetical protein